MGPSSQAGHWSHAPPGTWAKQGNGLQELSHAALLFVTLKVMCVTFARIPLARTSHVACLAWEMGAVQMGRQVGSTGDSCWS